VARSGIGDLGLIRDDVRAAAVEVMISAGQVYDSDMFDHDCRTLIDADTDMCLRLLRDELSGHGKQTFLNRMIAVAHADGDLTVPEQRTLITIGASLGMAAPHINGILATAVKRHQSAG
jgi:tellurite resistance protein